MQEKVAPKGQGIGIVRTRLLGMAKEVEMWDISWSGIGNAKENSGGGMWRIQKCKPGWAGGTGWLRLTLTCREGHEGEATGQEKPARGS